MLFTVILAAVAAVIAVAAAIFLFTRYGKGSADPDPDGATTGHSGAMLSALFLLVFAIAVIIPLTNIDTARGDTYTETQGLTEAYWSAGDLPAKDAAMIRSGLRDYTTFVASKEWPVMAKGRLSDVGWEKLDGLRAAVTNLKYSNMSDQNVQADVLMQIRSAYAARRQLAADAKASLPEGILIFTVLTAVIMLIYPLIAGARPRGWAIVPLMVMAAMLGVSIYLVFNINHTFSGDLKVKPDAFTSALREFQRIGRETA